MRTLIVGAGIAGLTLAGLLARQGESPVVIDRRPEGADLGYGLALWPHGSRVFHALGVHEEFVTRSEPMRSYVARDGAGRLLSTSPLPTSIAAYGHLGLIPRSDLLGMLRPTLGGVEVRDGVGIEGLTQTADQVDVGFDDGTRGTFDLVVGTDGIHSRVRELLFGRIPTGTPAGGAMSGGPTRTWQPRGRRPSAGVPAASWAPTRAGSRCASSPAPPSTYSKPTRPRGAPTGWRPCSGRTGCRSRTSWPICPATTSRSTSGRWPTCVPRCGCRAGSRWSETPPRPSCPPPASAHRWPWKSAAVLADELSRTNPTYLPNALALYQQRRRKRVEAAQTQSRRLARLMFLNSSRLATLRDHALRLASMERMVGPLIKDLREPI